MRREYIEAETIGQRFKKRHYDERLGWHEKTVNRNAVREELVNRLSQSSLDRTSEKPNADPDTFYVNPFISSEPITS